MKKRIKRSNEQSIGEVIRNMIQDLGLEEKILEAQTEDAWNKMMGNWVGRYTENIQVKNRVLYVRLNSAALKNELVYGRTKIITNINEELGKEFLLDVKFI